MYTKIIKNLILPFGDLVFRSNVMGHYKKWHKISKMSESEISDLSRENLLSQLEFITSKVEFYKPYRKYRSDDPHEWLQHLPIMKKQNIKENLDSLMTQDKRKLIKKSTSGSSGVQGITYMSRDEQDINRAIQMLWMCWSGWEVGMPILQTGMTIKRGMVKKLKDFFLRTHYYSAFGLSEKEIFSLLQQYRGSSNRYVGGYASSLYVLANVANKNEIKDITFKGAISWGDKMFPHFRKEIKSAFGCDVTDTYGCSEGLMIASQKDIDYYYIMSPHIHLELLDSKGKPVEDGELGYVVVTRLDARALPLIRYYTGDLAIRLKREDYPIKREFNFPLLERVVGRDTDIVTTKEGNILIVHFFTGIFEFIPEIKQFRVVQNDINGIKIEYIKGPNFYPFILERTEKRIREHVEDTFIIDWEEVEYIAPTNSGKPQIIKSFLGNTL